MDVVASEWGKLRTVRSSWVVLLAIAAAIALGTVIVVAMVADFDDSSAAEQARFEAADMAVVMLPVVQLAVAALAALAVTTEYGTGMMRTTLVTVPRRRVLYGAKLAVIAGTTLVLGELAAALMYLCSWLPAHGRAANLAPWASVTDGIPEVLANGLSVAVIGVMALGIGTAVRSTAGALVTMTMLLFVLPIVALLLPGAVGPWLYAVSPMNLGPELAGVASDGDGAMSPGLAAGAMAFYVVVSVVAGWLMLSKRDA
jgi:ABC-2 type transport system permease protein